MKQLRLALWLLAAASTGLFIAPALQAEPPTAVPAATTATTLTASARTRTVNGRQVGEVLIGDTVAMTITAPVGDYSAGERAQIVAARLTDYLAQGLTWQDIQVGMRGGQVVLYIGNLNNVLITVAQADARAAHLSQSRLAMNWRNSIQTALRQTTGSAVAGSQERWPDWTNPATKIVPIVSIGTPGAALGFAQVSGPSELVDQVKSVVQLEAVFEKVARIYAFVPSESLTGINRVQGVAVTALLQYRAVTF